MVVLEVDEDVLLLSDVVVDVDDDVSEVDGEVDGEVVVLVRESAVPGSEVRLVLRRP